MRWSTLALLLLGCASGPDMSSGQATETVSVSSSSASSSSSSTGTMVSESGSGTAEPDACDLSPGDSIVLVDRVVLHDFDDRVEGCAPDFGPSGVDFHPGLERIVVASDKGQYALVSSDGQQVSCHDLPGDNEGVVVVDPISPRVVFVGEGEAGDGAGLLTVVDLSTHSVVGTHVVAFEGGAVGNQGVEALAWTTGFGDLAAGFLVGDQSLGEVRSGCDVPWQGTGSSEPVACSQAWSVEGLAEVTGADTDHERSLVWLSSDDDDRLLAVPGPGAAAVFDISLPPESGPGQEGHAVFGCTLLLSLDANDDARRLVRYTMRADRG